jgi:subtilisin-like proprotein convertase family protein
MQRKCAEGKVQLKVKDLSAKNEITINQIRIKAMQETNIHLGRHLLEKY